MSNLLVKYTGHGANTGGLQGHSVGEDYPYAIVGVESYLAGPGGIIHACGWRVVACHREYQGPLRETYRDASLDILLQKKLDEVRLGSRSAAYREGFHYAVSFSRTGNPYQINDPAYGQFGSGFFDARALSTLGYLVNELKTVKQ